MPKILQVNYRLTIPVADFLQNSGPVAELISQAEGLKWKIWLANENSNEGGGIYLFDDEASLQVYLDGPVIAKLKSHPAVAEVTAKTFDVPADLSTTTRAPV
jgi:hypothetical protein